MAGRRVAAPAITVRQERAGDVEAVRAVLLAAFATPAESRLVEQLRQDEAFLPQLSLVAVDATDDDTAADPADDDTAADPADDDTAADPAAEPARARRSAVIGHVLLTRLRVGDEDALALAPLSVRPDRQGRGVGTALLEASLAAADAAGERLVVVVGDPDYYGRFGFGPAADLGITTAYGDGRHVMALALPRARVSGLPSGEALYAAPFAAF